MGLDEVVEKLNKTVLANQKIPEDARMIQAEKLIPDKAKIFSKQRMEVIRKLEKGEYRSDTVLRKDLKSIGNDLSWAIIVNANLRNLDFSGVNFSVADLSGSDFSNCIMDRTDLSIARLTNARFTNTRMEVANLSMVDCSNADFSGASASMVNFTSCIAENTNFSNANLVNADFFNSILRNANFNGANTTGINLADCLLDGTIFENTEKSDAEKKKKYQASFGKLYEAVESVREYLASNPVYDSGNGAYKKRRAYK
jgi:uncharacterized protein YjbI with pentapeptide repeats